MKEFYVKDFTIGVLVIVISLFFTTFSYKLAGEPTFFTFLGIYISAIFADKILSFGLDLIRGLVFVVQDDKNES
ncbi:hypothetical protein UFOVP787_98 [uncultured Caudovirales phage]|uniref:Uncharacterized protein n=1 Tax=uncultured Caudovirales phage TaxID=2100421 RepID=A0A6J5NZY3_9CAUD|nr:hypothetical protein UFOVP787_98 [uncultured Caudovirales phage]